MAILHADFGSYDDAVDAMNETVAIARENKDMACLNLGLSWLYHFRTTYGQTQTSKENSLVFESEEDTLAFLKSKAHEEKMWSIVSSTLLSEAKLSLSRVSSRRAVETHHALIMQ